MVSLSALFGLKPNKLRASSVFVKKHLKNSIISSSFNKIFPSCVFVLNYSSFTALILSVSKKPSQLFFLLLQYVFLSSSPNSPNTPDSK